MRVDVGSLDDLKEKGCLTGKLGSHPVCVFWHEEHAFAIDDRCPHLGFPLHRGTVENGIITCHWHHARFDLCTGGTLDPFADDARAYPVDIAGGRVVVSAEVQPFDKDRTLRRLEEGLEDGLSLVIAKAVLAHGEAGEPVADLVSAGACFGSRFREQGFGPGLTVLCAMANVLDCLEEADRPLALVHGLSFLSGDTRGRPPRFALAPLSGPSTPPVERLGSWYRRFIESRSGDAAERVLASAISSGAPLAALSRMMGAAATDHLFLDEGHILDFTNKAFELVGHLGPASAALILPTLVHETAGATRHEEEGAWRHPYDLAGLCDAAASELPGVLDRAGWDGLAPRGAAAESFEKGGGPSDLAWRIVEGEPQPIVEAILDAIGKGASAEQLGRAVALAAALRITRFHVQNDHGDWNVVHHGFTTANALHQMLVRAPSALLLRGLVQLALKVYLDRFLNVPAARLPEDVAGDLGDLPACWDVEGMVDEAGRIAYGFLRGGGKREELLAQLGGGLLAEDAGFHWFQTYEAAARQAAGWPRGSEEEALILAGTARFLAAHTPTRRELSQTVRIATRLRRGEALYEEAEPPA